MSNELTLEVLQRSVPRKKKGLITQDMVDHINGALTDSAELHVYRENILGYIGILQDGKFKIQDYVKAVKYCSLKLLGSSNIEAYTKTFPGRYQYFIDNGTEDRHIAGHVSLYNGGILVNKIMEQSMVPHHILNMDMYQKALNTQTELMLYAKSEKVRSDAANSILTHLKVPETVQVDLNIGIKEDDSIKELRQTTLELVAQQRLAIQAGVNTVREIAHSKIVREVIDVEDSTQE